MASAEQKLEYSDDFLGSTLVCKGKLSYDKFHSFQFVVAIGVLAFLYALALVVLEILTMVASMAQRIKGMLKNSQVAGIAMDR